eukprot:sb/3477522/
MDPTPPTKQGEELIMIDQPDLEDQEENKGSWCGIVFLGQGLATLLILNAHFAMSCCKSRNMFSAIDCKCKFSNYHAQIPSDVPAAVGSMISNREKRQWYFPRKKTKN